MTKKGILIPIGGNEDKGPEVNESYNLDFVKDGILSRVVRESGGVDAKILVIPTASRIPVEVGGNYMKAFGGLGCTDVTVLNITDREHAEKPAWLQLVEEADCIMFSGGDQSRIVDIIGQSSMHKILTRRYEEEGLVIAGTSAGAMAMSTEMISGGSSSEALVKGAVDMRDGMNFIPNLIIDTHFIKRGRFGRMAEAVARHPKLLGVGLAEDTGLVIRDSNHFTVIGSGMVIIFDPSDLEHNNEKILPEGMPMTMANLRVHVLANSDTFTIDKKEIHVLPIDAEFE
ncbi:MAG: cyanophycinase [Saprospiraceae bacterium]